MTKHNFLIGKGERLVEDVAGVRGASPKYHPYTLSEAKNRLTPMLARVVRGIDELPDAACPDDQVVATVMLNPEYIAKSYFPAGLLRTIGLETVGSRPCRVTPEKRSKRRPPEESITTELFVMGPRSAYHAWRSGLPNWSNNSPGANQLIMIEQVATPALNDKIKGKLPSSGDAVFEVVLHSDAVLGENRIVPGFHDYLASLGVEQKLSHRFYAGGLCFIELDAPAELAEKIATFTPVRALRLMPKLRMMRPTLRASRVPMQSIQLPLGKEIDSNIRAAIFDVGVPKDHPLSTWATLIDAAGVGETSPDFQEHGVAVTSAFLFGHIDPTKPISRPYAPVDHYRVLDTKPGQNPHELYDVLSRIDNVLVEKEYDFINLSIGPRLPIEDDEVHAWTAVLDDRLSNGSMLATIAVGNDGKADTLAGLNRVQVPADCVNGLSVGACDSPEGSWQRCDYSSVGPGRSPGLVKPDFVEFGGCLQRPFIVVSDQGALKLKATEGTSFSAPSVLRLATGVRAHFGASLGTLAIRALLIHTTEPSELPCEEVGRGRIARTLPEIVTCDDDTIRVVYQGKISPARYIRAPIPLPSGTMPGSVLITATLCYLTEVDPHHPGNYTRAGLEAAFRPHDQKRKKPSQIHTNTKSFFSKTEKGLMEYELRRDAWKWENCLHSAVTFQGRSLRNPVFDIHYNARLEGRNFTPDHELSYALVVSVQAKKFSDLYDTVVRRYATLIEPLRPVVEIPIST